MGGLAKKLHTYPHQRLHPSLQATMFSVMGGRQVIKPHIMMGPISPFLMAPEITEPAKSDGLSDS